jgi:type IV pilus assembly protein PilX
MRNHRLVQIPQRCSGAVLIVALVLLLVLTVLGTAGIQDTTLEERIAGNFRDADVALQSAETALRAGESYLIANLSSLSFSVDPNDKSSGLYDIGPSGLGKGIDASAIPSDSNDYFGSGTDFQVTTGLSDQVSRSAGFYIEKLPPALFESDIGTGAGVQVLELDFYRITGRGFGISPNSTVTLQSTFLPSF